MNKIFNTTFESSLRILLLLSVSGDEQMTLDRIADYDFITIYSKYFGISDMALHGENEFGLSEFAARRGMTSAPASYSHVHMDFNILFQQLEKLWQEKWNRNMQIIIRCWLGRRWSISKDKASRKL